MEHCKQTSICCIGDGVHSKEYMVTEFLIMFKYAATNLMLPGQLLTRQLLTQTVAHPTIAHPDSCSPDSCSPDSCSPDSCSPDNCSPPSDSCSPNSCSPDNCSPDSCSPYDARQQSGWQVKYLFEAISERLIPLERLFCILFVCAK